MRAKFDQFDGDLRTGALAAAFVDFAKSALAKDRTDVVMLKQCYLFNVVDVLLICGLSRKRDLVKIIEFNQTMGFWGFGVY